MKNYFAYIRVSTVRQGEYGVSLQEQRDAIQLHAENKDLSILKWFEEKATAAKSGRPVFAEMIDLLKRGKADGVVMHKLDRGARNLRDWARLGELLDQGVDVQFVNDNSDLNTRGGRLSADIQAAIAADFIRNLKQETLKGFYGRLRQGLYPLPAPLGYVNNGKGKAKTICPTKGPLVKQAFELYATGEYSLEMLSDNLYTLGLRNQRDDKLSRASLAKALGDPFYIGLIKIKRTGETFRGVHEALISTALFEQVAKVLKQRIHRKIHKHAFLFRQLITCMGCNRHLVGERQRGRVYYRCHTKECAKCCVREDVVEQKVEEALKGICFTEREKEFIVAKAKRLGNKSFQGVEESRKQLQVKRELLSQKLKRLIDAHEEALIDKEDFLQRKEAIHKELLGITEQLEAHEKIESAPGATPEYIRGLIRDPYGAYQRASKKNRRRLVKCLLTITCVGSNTDRITLRAQVSIQHC